MIHGFQMAIAQKGASWVSVVKIQKGERIFTNEHPEESMDAAASMSLAALKAWLELMHRDFPEEKQ